MPRAIGDTTSTCGTCSYWEHLPDADGLHATRLGQCGWLSLPAWALKQFKGGKVAPGMQKMREDAGVECWLHEKRRGLERNYEHNFVRKSSTHYPCTRCGQDMLRKYDPACPAGARATAAVNEGLPK